MHLSFPLQLSLEERKERVEAKQRASRLCNTICGSRIDHNLLSSTRGTAQWAGKGAAEQPPRPGSPLPRGSSFAKPNKFEGSSLLRRKSRFKLENKESVQELESRIGLSSLDKQGLPNFAYRQLAEQLEELDLVVKVRFALGVGLDMSVPRLAMRVLEIAELPLSTPLTRPQLTEAVGVAKSIYRKVPSRAAVSAACPASPASPASHTPRLCISLPTSPHAPHSLPPHIPSRPASPPAPHLLPSRIPSLPHTPSHPASPHARWSTSPRRRVAPRRSTYVVAGCCRSGRR